MYTPVMIDKMRNFRYGMKAISIIEKTLNAPIAKLDFDSLTMYQTAVIIYAGLVHEDKNLTVDKVMDMIDDSENSFTNIIAEMGKAIGEAFGDAKTKN